MIRVELHDRSNNLLRVLAGAKNASYHTVLNQDGSGSFKIHRTDADVAALSILTGGIDGYIVHLLRKGPLETTFTDRFAFVVEAVAMGIDQQEDANAWLTVSGRGTLCLLEGRLAWPPGFDGANASSITSQWQQYAAVSGGAIMDAELDRSASRFTPTITHTIQSTSVLQTVKLRFDDLRALHDALVKSGPMDAQMVGLDYQAVDQRGTDKSSSVTVQMAAQDSLLGVSLERDASKVSNWIVAQGTGEGINSKIAVQFDSSAVAALRRREAFVDDRQVDDQTQLALDAAGALSATKLADQRITTSFFDSSHTQIYRDFDLGDTIGLAVQPIGFSQKYRVVGITVADTDNEIETCALDLNSMRAEYLIKLTNGVITPTVRSVGVINRIPQGSQWNDSMTYPDNCGPGFPFHFDLWIPSNILQLNHCLLSFKLRAFRGYEATTAAESSHTHGVPAESVSSVTSTAQAHFHNVQLKHGLSADETPGYNRSNSLFTTSDTIDHTAATLTDGSHTHSVSGQTTGGTTSNAGSSHVHAMAAGIYENAVATGVTVKVNGVDRTSILGGGSGFTTDQTELALTLSWLTVGAWNTIDLTPTGLGRIIGHLLVSGYSQSI